jgi:hypothetical protein
MRQPLSQSLEQLLFGGPGTTQVTMNAILDRTEGRGFYMLMIILCLPYIAPLPIGGTSTILGGIILLLAIRLALAMPPRLPAFIGEKPVPFGRMPRLAHGSVAFLRFIEKWVKPRNTSWLSWRLARTGNALLLAFMAFLLALPLPIPATNMLPSYAIVLLAASMMEEDGRMIWVGYAVSLVTVLYFVAWAVIILFFPKYYSWLLHRLEFWR